MKIEETESVSGKVVAKMFGVTPQAITNWRNDEDCPVNGDNAKTFNLSEVVQWRVRKGAVRSTTSKAHAGEKERLTSLQADLKQIELDLARKKVLLTSEVVSGLRTMFVACRVRIMSIGQAISPVVAGLQDHEEIKDMIDDRCREALVELASYTPTVAVDDGGDEMACAARKTIRKRLGQRKKSA